MRSGRIWCEDEMPKFQVVFTQTLSVIDEFYRVIGVCHHILLFCITTSVTGRRCCALISESAGFAAPVHVIVLSRSGFALWSGDFEFRNVVVCGVAPKIAEHAERQETDLLRIIRHVARNCVRQDAAHCMAAEDKTDRLGGIFLLSSRCHDRPDVRVSGNPAVSRSDSGTICSLLIPPEHSSNAAA